MRAACVMMITPPAVRAPEQAVSLHDECALMHSSPAGVIARTVSDVALFNVLFSDCQEAYPEVELKGLRVGYPTNFWADLGGEVRICPWTRAPNDGSWITHSVLMTPLTASRWVA